MQRCQRMRLRGHCVGMWLVPAVRYAVSQRPDLRHLQRRRLNTAKLLAVHATARGGAARPHWQPPFLAATYVRCGRPIHLPRDGEQLILARHVAVGLVNTHRQ